MKLHLNTYEDYKQSEGEWEDKVPFEWQEKRVKDLFRMITQTAPANNDYELLSLYASIGVRPRKDLEARGNKASSTDGYWMVKKNDIVVNKLLAWMGSVGLSEYDGVTSPAYDVLRQIKTDIEPRYYAYLFRTEIAKKIFRKNSRGIMDMRLRLYFDKLGAITVPVPPYETQYKIADYIDLRSSQIDKKIELLIKKEILYRNLRKSIIRQAILTGINDSKDIAYKDSIEPQNFPEHWKLIRLKDVIKVRSGDTGIQKTENGLYPIYGANGVIGTTNFYNQTKNTILIGRVGSCGEITEAKGKYVVSDNALIVTLHKCVSHDFMLYKLTSMNLEQYSNKNAQPLLTGSTIKNLITSIPPLQEQLDINEYIYKKTIIIDRAIDGIISYIKKLKELRIAMINDAVTGKIKVVDERDKKGQAA